MLILQNIAKHYGGRTLFDSLNVTIGTGERIGLVGPNGSGKTTLLEILAGHLEPDGGSRSLSRDMTIGYLLQDVPKFTGRSVLDETLAGHERLAGLEEELRALERALEREEDTRALARLSEEHGAKEHAYQELGGYQLDAKAKKILGGLGFQDEDLDRPTEEFSGGWLMRAALAKLLLMEPGLLLLDEPTNYLDLPSVVWLESYLAAFPGSLVLVSHDRELLRRLPNQIWDVEDCTIVPYSGNYDFYLKAKALREEGLEARRKAEARFLEKETRFIERFRYKNTKAKAVQSRIKRLDKMEFAGDRRTEKRVVFRLPEAPPSARVQVELRAIGHAYGEQVVYESIDWMMERGERVAFVGPNGAGKTTLLKIIGGELEPTSGERALGRGVKLGMFSQHQTEALDLDATILEEVQRVLPTGNQERARSMLGRFLFSKEDVFKKISVLSGGEKARVALAKILASPPNVLLLDEPTSHLDIASREVLEDALSDFDGSIIVISHDREFLSRLADRIVEITAGTLREFMGTYDEYKAVQDAGGLAVRDTNASGGGISAREESERGEEPGLSKKEEKRLAAERRNALYRKRKPVADKIEAIEAEIEKLTAEIEALEHKMADPAHYETPEFAKTLSEYKRKKTVVTSKTARWEDLAERLEAIERDAEPGGA
ncbi:MAG: ABC-F family ATP-binding cassette domain-containing protein [Gemmatimonadetes bacterium]|nr:ABC-F family ATP-binding cassette domain-containing protein [Gemmatimonadota bacterium]